MEFKLLKLDIDELINDFAECESSSFVEIKKVWLSKKFSFIYESSPSTDRGVFMQTLYAHSIGYIGSTNSLSKRVGGLFCLYCLYETQPFNPPFRMYMSLGCFKVQIIVPDLDLLLDLLHMGLWPKSKFNLSTIRVRRLVNLNREAKMVGPRVVSVSLKRMLERNMFLFGAKGVIEVSATEKVNYHGDEERAHMQAFYEKLFNEREHGAKLKEFIHMDMGKELKLDLLKKRSSEYAAAKELAINEAGEVVDVQDIKHIAQSKRLIGDAVNNTVIDWNAQKELLYQQTGLCQENDDSFDDDIFDKELEEAFNILD